MLDDRNIVGNKTWSPFIFLFLFLKILINFIFTSLITINHEPEQVKKRLGFIRVSARQSQLNHIAIISENDHFTVSYVVHEKSEKIYGICVF